MNRPSWYKNKEQIILADAESRHVDLGKYYVAGHFSTGCNDGHRKVCAILLLHEKKPSPLPWVIKGIDGTRCFHDFHSAAVYIINVYARKRPLTQRQASIVSQAYHEHLESGEPFVFPDLKKRGKQVL